MKKILIILFTLLNFSNSHHFGEQITIDVKDINENDWNDKVTNIFSQSKEMATCTCDLTSHCDIYCCCDEKCSEDLRKEWTENSLCLNNNKKWVEDYKCKNGEETFKYNKEKAGINIKDHIFNIMCIKYDRSSDMVNYYLQYNEETDNPKILALKQNWIDNFFAPNPARSSDQSYKYGEKIESNLLLYKADSNGNCISTSFYFLVPFESSCHGDLDTTKIGSPTYYGDIDGTISEVTYIFKYSSENKIDPDKIEVKVLRYKLDSDSKQIKFKVQWKKNEEVTPSKKFPPGYLQGNPIKIGKKDNNNPLSIYNYGYYFHIYNSEGKCIEDITDNSIYPITILFKNDMFISCKSSDNPTKTVIYRIYTSLIGENNENLYFYSAPNATQSIEITDKTDPNSKSNLNNKNIKINLIFLTTQKGKENSPYDIIQKVYTKVESEEVEESDKIISLNVKFVDFSFSSIENSKNNITTNSIPLPEKLIEKMSE